MTPAHQKVLFFINDFKESNGFSPSLMEIAKGIPLHGKTSVSRILSILREGGYLEEKEKYSVRDLTISKTGELYIKAYKK